MSGADVVAVAVAVVGDANESGPALLIMGSVMLKARGPLVTDRRCYIALAFFASERRVVSACISRLASTRSTTLYAHTRGLEWYPLRS